jgi:hypothetical protein
LVGNPDAYSVQQENGKYLPARAELTDSVLRAHLEGAATIGTYIGHVVDGKTVARTLCFDVDSGEEVALDEIQRIKTALVEELGVPDSCLGIEFSGRKGYHLWLPLTDPRPNHELRRVGRAALFLAGVKCEVYPKQDEVKDLGNLVKLPGGVHRLTGNHNDFIDQVPTPMPVNKWEELIARLPEEQRSARKQSDTRFPCMEAIQNEGVQEGGRNIQLFHLATMLRRAGVTDENVEVIIRRTNERGDPLDEDELVTLLESSLNSGPICQNLPEDRQCGELCIRARIKGLFTRPGQLRYAAEGENVVVTVAERGPEKNMVTFEHDDVGRMRAVLR